MRRFVATAIWTLALLLTVTTVQAQDWARKMFETTEHNFGTVARGAKAEFDFKFSNIYMEPVHVVGVRSSCGCTTPTVTKDTLATYDESSIHAAFDTRNHLGQKNATITVLFDKPFVSEVQLQVAGYIRSDVVITPGSVELGNVDKGTQAAKTVTVTYAGRPDWKIIGVKPGNGHLQPSMRETSRGAGQVSYELTVQIGADAPVGYFKDQIVLVTNDQAAAELPVDVEARVISEVTVAPTSLFLGVLQPGQSVTKQLFVQGKRPFKVTAIKCEDSSFKFQNTDASKPVHLIPVTFTAGNEPGKVTCKIEIETDLGDDVRTELEAYAQIVESATAAETPTTAVPR